MFKWLWIGSITDHKKPLDIRHRLRYSSRPSLNKLHNIICCTYCLNSSEIKGAEGFEKKVHLEKSEEGFGDHPSKGNEIDGKMGGHNGGEGTGSHIEHHENSTDG